MRVIDYFRQGLRHGPDRPAFIEGDRVVTWGAAAERVERIAGAMAAAGLNASSRVGVYSPNDSTAFTAILASFRLGAVWAPINARNTLEANGHWLRLMGCHALIYHSSLEAEALELKPLLQGPAVLVCLDREGPGGIPSLDRFEAMAAEPAPEPPDGDDVLASVFPTGGTTGLSKAAEWSLQTWETLVATFWQCLPCASPPVHLVAGPMTHAAGVLALCSLAGGTTNVILKTADPSLILETIERRRVTHIYLPPTLIYSLLDHPDARRRDYSSLKYLVVAASPIAPAKLREAMEVFGAAVCQSYGQRGEIVARGHLVSPGYHRNPEATAAAREHGWHHTGDIGYRDAEGFIYIVDRAKDMIITGGFNVFSAEIEQVVLSHPSVRECAVVGVPDPKWGEAVKAVVELKDGAQADEAGIIAMVKARLGSVHAPKSVEFWPELPRSAAGKVLKRDIRAVFWQGRDRAIG